VRPGANHCRPRLISPCGLDARRGENERPFFIEEIFKAKPYRIGEACPTAGGKITPMRLGFAKNIFEEEKQP